jgi:hypothetical protein
VASVRQALAGAGLVAILWLGIQLVQNSISVVDAGIRAVIALVVVVVLSRLATAGVKLLAATLE